jgi:hypothetical protein
MKSEHRASVGSKMAITGYARGKAAAQHSLDSSTAGLVREVRCWAVDHSSEVELIGVPILPPKYGSRACFLCDVSSQKSYSARGNLH